jgi:hypothetical protein
MVSTSPPTRGTFIAKGKGRLPSGSTSTAELIKIKLPPLI